MNLKNISVLSDLRCLPQGPGPALCLGVAGLIPFVTAPLYMANSGYFLPDIATAQLAYGASILSFLGGVRCVIYLVCLVLDSDVVQVGDVGVRNRG